MSTNLLKPLPPSGFERVGDNVNSTGEGNRFAIDMVNGGDVNELKPEKAPGGEAF